MTARSVYGAGRKQSDFAPDKRAMNSMVVSRPPGLPFCQMSLSGDAHDEIQKPRISN